jgi:hypothetical protein
MSDWDLMVVAVLKLLGQRSIDRSHAETWLRALVEYAETGNSLSLPH